VQLTTKQTPVGKAWACVQPTPPNELDKGTQNHNKFLIDELEKLLSVSECANV
jgi:hypothetical protein